MARTTINISLTPETVVALDAARSCENRSRSNYIENLLLAATARKAPAGTGRRQK